MLDRYMFSLVGRSEAGLAASALLFWSLAAAAVFPTHREKTVRPVYFAPGPVLARFTFGFAEATADLLYLRLIQDMDFCGAAGSSRAEVSGAAAPPASDSPSAGKPVSVAKSAAKGGAKLEGTEGEKAEKPPRVCRLGWSYRMTDAVTELDPRFLGPYLTAASIMSVITRDREGAGKIYDKGLERFPDNWRVSFHAGYHYIHEMKNDEKGVRALLQSARSGGPPWLFSLAAKKFREAGKQLLAYQALKEFLKKDEAAGGRFRPHIQKRLKETEREMRKAGLSPEGKLSFR